MTTGRAKMLTCCQLLDHKKQTKKTSVQCFIFMFLGALKINDGKLTLNSGVLRLWDGYKSRKTGLELDQIVSAYIMSCVTSICVMCKGARL